MFHQKNKKEREQKVIFKIGNTANPEVKSVIEAPDLPTSINYILLTNGTCIIATQYAKKIGGQNRD